MFLDPKKLMFKYGIQLEITFSLKLNNLGNSRCINGIFSTIDIFLYNNKLFKKINKHLKVIKDPT